jgi:hypothetical protein
MALENSSSDDAYEIFRELDWFHPHAILNETRDDTELTPAATTGGEAMKLQQPVIPLTSWSSPMRSDSSQSVCPRAPVGIDVSPVLPDDISDHAPIMQDPRDRVVK